MAGRPKQEVTKSFQFKIKLTPMENYRLVAMADALHSKKSFFLSEVIKYFWNLGSRGDETPENIVKAEAFIKYIGDRTINDPNRTKIPFTKLIILKQEFDVLYDFKTPINEIEMKLDSKYGLILN